MPKNRPDWRSGFASSRRERNFRGDEKNYLPRAVFDYKMWFELLKLAHRSPAHSIQESRYEGWERKGLSLSDTLDSVKSKKVGSGFKAWFFDEEHWRTLFSVPVRPAEIVKSEASFRRNREKDRLVLAVSLGKTVPELRSEIDEILIRQARLRGSKRGQAPKVDARYVIPENKQIEMTTYLRMLRVHECDREPIHWTKMYTALSERYRRPPSEIKVDLEDDADTRRVYQMIFRDRTRLRAILKNVCKGIFP